MKDQDQMTAEEQAEQEFAEAFADETAGAPDEDSASTDDNNFTDDDADDSDDAPEADAANADGELAPDQEGKAAEKELSTEEKAHGYDSMFGRLEKERNEKAQLRDELEALRSQPAAPPVAPDPAPAVPVQQAASDFEVPDELKDDLAAVEKEDPQLAALFKEDTTDGKRLRGVLEDYGSDMALIQASTVQTARDAAAQVSEQGEVINQTVQQSANEAHNAAVYAAVDGYEDLATNPDRALESQQYHQDLRTWVGEQPYATATEKFAVIEKGTPAQVASLINEFNATRETQATPPVDEKTKAAANAALAVDSKPGPLPKSKGSKDDFDAGWDED
ncbi:hypothetical protein SYK_06670 [Pseudodesulfovibrio nedwellii]|uniref:Scaffolding protein n=1 Tax=Pseudodesulfovibrio nedwellii TaxID=2973072 RepID=A0ABN6S2R5_9BACT|nr:hypothetical protein [Pseudodesulfovibrio nedwellii]BDQ36307.1 hypothetical protein SYK_06670 [Pseudodesulfovibrio nedwellii]